MNVYEFYDSMDNGWYGDKCMDNRCRAVKNECGIYAIMIGDVCNKLKKKLVYIGYSSNLKLRMGNHELLRFLRITYNHTDFIPFYRYMLSDNIPEAKIAESKLILEYKPMYNTQK